MNTNSSITQGGRVVANAVIDKEDLLHRKKIDIKKGSVFKKLYGNSSTDDLYMHIVPGEPLFMYKKKASVGASKKRKAYRDTDLVVFSSLNGIIAKKNQSAHQFEDDITFVGFADIQTVYNSAGFTKDDALVQIGGLRTTVNTGKSEILSGDVIYWSLPSGDRLNSHSKIVAQLCPLKKHQQFAEDSLESQIITNPELGKLLNRSTSEIQDEDDNMKLVETWAKVLDSLYNDHFLGDFGKLKSKIVGRAMSSASPGQEFDILVGASTI